MIAQLRGTIIDIHGSVLTVDVGGVGYEVFASRTLIENSEVGSTGKVIVYTDVREDSIRRPAIQCECLEKVSRPCRKSRRRNPLPRHVRDGQAGALTVQRKHGIEIAPHFPAGQVTPRDG